MRPAITGLLLLLQIHLYGQVKEFEGEIHYKHLFRYASKDIDSVAIRQNYGTASTYIYKEGAYRWTFDSCAMAEEYYSSEKGKTYNRAAGSEEFSENKKPGYTRLLKYEVLENADTICGYVCNRLKVMTGNKSDKSDVLVRFIFYAPALAIDPGKFKKFSSYANDEVYKITRSAFLRIEMVSPFLPFIIRMEADKVVPRPVEKSEVTLSKMPG